MCSYNGDTWQYYNTGNSGIAHDSVEAIATDATGNKWLGTRGGVSMFNGSVWTNYHAGSSGLLSNRVYAVAIDGAGNKWFGTSA